MACSRAYRCMSSSGLLLWQVVTKHSDENVVRKNGSAMTATGAAMVSHTVDGGIAWITLDGEATRNALDSTSADRLVAACDAIDADRTVGVAIIIGANRTFCSGAVREVLFSLAGEPAHVAYEELSRLYRSFQRVGRLTVPSVAAIDGAAVGAGLNLALAADVRIATAQSRLISGFTQ